MKKIITLVITAIIALTCQAQLKNQMEKMVKQNDTLYIRENGHDYKVDTQTITVKLKEGKSLDTKGCSVIRENKLGYIDITVPEGKQVEEYAKELDESGIFENVELNTYFDLCSVSINDPYSSALWYLDRTNVRKAWDYGMGNSSIKVAIIDSSVKKDHPDIGYGSDSYKNIDESLGWDFVGGALYSTPVDNHGTHVAGIIGAKTNNGIGTAGIAGGNHQPGITLISYNVVRNDGLASSAVIDDAILVATNNGVKVINISLGGPYNSTIASAINHAYNNGVAIFAATGNDSNSSIKYPASDPKVFAVGASTQIDTRDYSSNYGAGLDIVAPGVNIYSTSANSLIYDTGSGTSYASPQVAGAAALMLSIKPNLTPNAIYTILRNTAEKISSYTFNSNGWNNEVGYGLLDVYAAVNQVLPLEISGDSFICDSMLYYIPNLPSSLTVFWDISNQYYKDSDYLFETDMWGDTQCIVRRHNSIPLSNDTLTAYVCDNYGQVIRTLKKCISTRTTARFYLDYEYSGIPIIMSASVSENETATVPLGAIVKMGSTRFRNMNITPSTTLPYFVHYQDSVKFKPSGIFSLQCVSNTSCDAFSLAFMTKIPQAMASVDFTVYHNGTSLSINRILNDIERDFNENIRFQDEEVTNTWKLDIYRYTDAKPVFTEKIEGNQKTINTAGWVHGIYIIRIDTGGQIFTQKIKI